MAPDQGAVSRPDADARAGTSFTGKHMSARVGIVVTPNAKTAAIAVNHSESHWRVACQRPRLSSPYSQCPTRTGTPSMNFVTPGAICAELEPDTTSNAITAVGHNDTVQWHLNVA